MKFEEFFAQRKNDLVQLTIPLRQEQGIGVTYINMCNPEKADVMYLPLSNELVPVNMKKDIIEKNKEKPSDLYFYFYNNTDNLFIVYDLVN